MLIDSHSHVQFPAFALDRDDVLARAREHSIGMIAIGTQWKTSQQAIELASLHADIWATVGLHPNHLVPQLFADEQELSSEDQHGTPETFESDRYRTLAQHPRCVAIGECGLDYYRLPVERREETIHAQKQTVRAHFDLATELDLPVVIHCRDAYADQLELVREYVEAGKLARRGVIHCFAGNLEEAQGFIDLGFKLGFTGVITFPPRKSDPLFDGLPLCQYVVREIPLASFLVETDAPYLTPAPHRGERNEPSYVRFVAQKIAEIRGISLEEVMAASYQNTQTLFRLEQKS